MEHPVDSETGIATKTVDINVGGPNPYIQFTSDGPAAGQHASTYVGSDTITTNLATIGDLNVGPIHMSYHHIRSDSTLYLSNDSDTNFDSHGSVGFQVAGGLGLGASTIYSPTTDIYFQKGSGNLNNDMGWSYSKGAKTTIHCQKVISQVANTVGSRLSIKTNISPVSYDRALEAVENTDIYDYQYINDDSGQHYVSGIIDDVNESPKYHMDDMLINKERTARIDGNLVGYHHVVLKELLEWKKKAQERIDALERQINKA